MKTILGGLFLMIVCQMIAANAPFPSHLPLRPLPQPSDRPMGSGPSCFVDSSRGDDKNKGTEESPWKTIARALNDLKAGETLYLRGGTYYENVYVGLTGKEGAPITIRSYPGEVAIIDGGLREFFDSPQKAWEPCPEGGPGEYRSTHTYPNLRHVMGFLGDSMIGLQVYYWREDLNATSEVPLGLKNPQYPKDSPLPPPTPTYCGPGLWYDQGSGHIHIRLAHTHLGINYPGISDYQGVEDPRQVPLVIAPFKAVPLFVDGAKYVKLQDLAVRGGGFDTVILQGAENVEFDNVIIYCGTYGLRSRYSGPVKFFNSALYGSNAPWCSRDDGRYNTKPGQPSFGRNIARLNTHALLVMEGHTEEQVYFTPLNHDWEMSYSDFTDGHDGIYFTGENMRFHHNRVEHMLDDAMYLTPLTWRASNNVYIYQNYFTQVATSFGFGGRSVAGGSTYIYRNIIDIREGATLRDRTVGGKISGRQLEPVLHFTVHGSHGSADTEFPPSVFGPLFVYQNTFLTYLPPKQGTKVAPKVDWQDKKRMYAQGTLFWTGKKSPRIKGQDAYAALSSKIATETEYPRGVFNNIFIYLNGMAPISKGTLPSTEDEVQIDGNLHWDLTPEGSKQANDALAAFRSSPMFEESKKSYSSGWEACAIVTDPKFVTFDSKPTSTNNYDYRLQKDSPAIGKGIVLPQELEDPLRPLDGKNPDIGALPYGSELFRIGRSAGAQEERKKQ